MRVLQARGHPKTGTTALSSEAVDISELFVVQPRTALLWLSGCSIEVRTELLER